MKRLGILGVACSILGMGCRTSPPEIPPAPPALLDGPLAMADDTPVAAEPEPEAAPRLVEPALPVPVFPNADRRERLLDAVPELEAIIEAFMKADHIPGLAVGLVIDEELAWARGFGVLDLERGTPVTPQSTFRIGSITKTFTMNAILRLRDEGRLDLDDPLAEHLALARSFRLPTDEHAGVTIRQVLTHASGLPRTGPFEYEVPGAAPIDRARLEQALQGLSMVGPAGVERRYSNLGYQLLGLLIEDVTGEDHRAHIDRVLLEPLGMKASGWHAADAVGPLATPHELVEGKAVALQQEDHGAASAGGGLYSTVEDLSRFAAFQLQAWPPRSGDDEGPVRRASLRESHRVHAFPGARIEAVEGGALAVRRSATGLTWFVVESCGLGYAVGHNGRNTGYTAAMLLLPRRGVGLVLMSNQRATDLAELGGRLLEQLGKSPALTARVVPIDPRAEARARELFAALTGATATPLEGWVAEGEGSTALATELAESAASLRSTHAACEVERVEGEAADLRVYGRCEGGRLRLSVAFDPQGRATRATLAPVLGSPPPALRKAARRVERLLTRWDESLAAETFAHDFRPSRHRSLLQALAGSHGRCRRGEVVEVLPTSLDQRLVCDRFPARLRLTIAEGEGRVTGLSIDDDPQMPPHCLRD